MRSTMSSTALRSAGRTLTAATSFDLAGRCSTFSLATLTCSSIPPHMFQGLQLATASAAWLSFSAVKPHRASHSGVEDDGAATVAEFVFSRPRSQASDNPLADDLQSRVVR